MPAARRRAHRGNAERARHPLRRDQPGRRQCGMALRDTVLRARPDGNFIKLHKTQLASDRTSCRSPLANQVRLVLHTGAYWLLLKVRSSIPKLQPLATAEFKTLTMRLIKI